MKARNLLLLGMLFPLSNQAQTSGSHYMYMHDDAGNIIFRGKTTSENRQRNSFDDDVTDRNTDSNSLVTIRTDASWSEVQIEIKGEISPNETLSVYTSDGIFVTFFRVRQNKFSLNLSYLQKGTYLFRFHRNRELIQQKIIKEN